MSSICVITTKKELKRIEPLLGYTEQRICELLNSGHALLKKMCPEGMPILHDCTHEEIIVRVDREDEAIAKVVGTYLSRDNTGWMPHAE